MTRRVVPFFALVVGFLCLSNGVANPAGENFVITSVTYTNAKGKQQTVNFDPKTNGVEIPAVAVKNDIIINGTYNPPNSLITSTIHVDVGFESLSGPPTIKNGAWTKTVAKGKLADSKKYTVDSSVNGGRVDSAIVNAVDVVVTVKTLTIAAP